ncbi:alpha-E domain-containing protein [Marinobacter nanhaiticus D15-8W]|uniref:Alpha-E domain-containing protein n=1 Tax=Marinobacter nanhaiticus D15-8W TaxID=626887 RepID=N6X7R5_9GAMM|nr:alpha-E domain-containing protein [Marinobacter nanhaiticus]ENO17188.1 alpha-E domain-containing protein [Marinobacter nanhaiticus D15-8W]BES72153.1 alpha-E domain-containing protein [Marinobacter nanhaiticus D15-8W]
MLARVAENVYWMGRYLERMDDTARLINATTHMLIDSHEDTRMSWPVLIDVLGEEAGGFVQEGSSSELGVMHYLIVAEDSNASIRHSCAQVRTNARCVREVIPRDFWEEINSLNLFVQSECKLASSRAKRYNLMAQVIRRCQAVVGVMDGTMLRDETYQLFNIGRHLERADMTTRIMDVLILQQLAPTSSPQSRRHFQWSSLLSALGATESYRRYFAQEEGETDVIDFLLTYGPFPRSVIYCMEKIEWEVRDLPNKKDVLKTTAKIRKALDSDPLNTLSTLELHGLIDTVQAGLIDLHGALVQQALHAPAA